MQRGIAKAPGPRKLRWIAWLTLGAMLYAGGLGHLLHPWLHQHAASCCAHHETGASGRGLQALHHGHAHGPCALCAFLAHFLAREAGPAFRGPAGLIPLGQAVAPQTARLVLALGRLPGSRSPPRAPVC